MDVTVGSKPLSHETRTEPSFLVWYDASLKFSLQIKNIRWALLILETEKNTLKYYILHEDIFKEVWKFQRDQLAYSFPVASSFASLTYKLRIKADLDITLCLTLSLPTSNVDLVHTVKPDYYWKPFLFPILRHLIMRLLHQLVIRWVRSFTKNLAKNEILWLLFFLNWLWWWRCIWFCITCQRFRLGMKC